MSTFYVVMEGTYESSVEGVFDGKHEDAAKRFANALQDGSYFAVDANTPDLIEFPYAVEYDPSDEYCIVSMVLKEKSESFGTVVPGEDCDIFTAYVHAKTRNEAEKKGKAMIREYAGLDPEDYDQ